MLSTLITLYFLIGSFYAIYALIKNANYPNKEYPLMTFLIGVTFGFWIFLIDLADETSYLRKDLLRLKKKYFS